jgi:predicted AlkP superfamily pyrophosphatase or phosphodiesterase
MNSRLAVLDVVGLTPGLLDARMPALSALAQRGGLTRVRPAFPAVTCTAQSSYLTGLAPADHGIVGNGWYDRELNEHQFWKQSNHIVRGEKLWETARRARPGLTCAKLFWWYNMYSSADWAITPRPMYPADGRKVFDIYTQPMGLREEIKRDLGEFPFPAFWGPMAGIASSEWIARSARWIEERHKPDLSLIYLPHLDYNLQRLGPDDPAIARDLGEIDRVAGDLVAWLEQRGVRVIVLSEYGITQVRRAIHPNRILRRHGWLTVKMELGRELLDCGASRAFAISDHQVAHIYLDDPSLEQPMREALLADEGVAEVLDAAGKRAAGLDHPRAGDLVAVAREDAWFTYYYWEDDAVAPDFARCVDIHRKYGYDPAELFFDPKLRAPKLRAAFKLLRKQLGFRTLMDLIPLDASLVRGSHGCVPRSSDDWPVLLGAGDGEPVDPATVHGILLRLLTGESDQDAAITSP